MKPLNTKVEFDSIDEALAALRRGEMIVVTDDEGRENEGDIISAAELTTPETINFMVTEGRGLVCVALPEKNMKQFGLKKMGSSGRLPFNTAFMESVDASMNATTGISAQDRAEAVRVLMKEDGQPCELNRPGHVFPIQAVPGGVLRRAGHTEAAVDLTRLAGMKPGGVICEIMREDGDMARLPDLQEFAAKHHLKLIKIEDLIAYRRQHEQLVHLERSVKLPTDHGEFTLKLYYSDFDEKHHIALVMGEPDKQESCLVRIHSECLTGDVFGSHRCDCGLQLEEAMSRVAAEGHGVVVYMRQEGRGIGLAHKIHAYELQEQGMDTVEANIHLGFDPDLREYGGGAQVLQELGLKKIRLMTNNPGKIDGLEQYGLEIVERVPIVMETCKHNKRYLDTKKAKMGHLL